MEMEKTYLQRMIDYHYWAQRRLWDCLLPLSEHQMQHDPGYSVGSLHNHLVHCYGVEWMWFQIVRGRLPDDWQAQLDEDGLTARQVIRARWQALESDIRSYLESADEEQLNRTVYQSLASPPRPSLAWESLLYIVTHAADHRSQMLQLIHALGGKTVMQDFIVYVWETDGAP